MSSLKHREFRNLEGYGARRGTGGNRLKSSDRPPSNLSVAYCLLNPKSLQLYCI